MIDTLVLLHPPQKGLLEGFSNSLISLANYVSLKEPGIDIFLLDLGHESPTGVSRALEAVKGRARGAVLVGITTTTASYQAALSTASICKTVFDGCSIVLGGHHASAQATLILKRHFPTVDYVISGEGEVALLELLRRHPSTNGVPGLTFMDRDVPATNSPPEYLTQHELDQLDVTFGAEPIGSARGKFDHVTYVSARGCPLKCAFCSVANADIRAKSIPCVLRDLLVLVEQCGYRNIAIEDNFFAHSAQRTLDLCHALYGIRRRHRLDFAWDCQTRVESISRPEVASVMKMAGCDAVYLGVESLIPRHLIYLGKTFNPTSYLRALEQNVVPHLANAGMNCYLNLQFGLPDESSEDRTETMVLLRRIGAIAKHYGSSVTVFPQLHVVYPGTRHFHEACAQNRYGAHTAEIFERFTQWESDQQPVLRWMGVHFAHGTGGLPEGIMKRNQLRGGAFELDPDKVAAVSAHLTDLGDLDGISIFDYARYVV